MARARFRYGHLATHCLLMAALGPLGCSSSLSSSQAAKRKTARQAEADAGRDSGPAEMSTEIPDAAIRANAPAPDAAVAPKIEPCRPLESMVPTPARSIVSSTDVRPSDRAIFTSDLFGMFKSNCGGCHVDTNLGAFQVKDANSFAGATRSRQQKIHDRMHSDDPALYMPAAGAPNAMSWSKRGANDPVVELSNLLDGWFAAGSPQDLFYVKNDAAGTMSTSPYLLSPEIASKLTNIGNCIPDKAIVGRETDKMDALDTFFAKATELPPRLDQTDLVALDSEVLARSGVISFAPAYPAFSDDARMMRHVRVPRDQSIAFDKSTQEFTIPENTRVYQTLLKKVVDKDGNERYRKIETRLIVSRPDGPDDPGNSNEHEDNALFGTYAWDEGETEATLVTDPLRNGEPFRDRVITYITDEGKAQKVLDAKPYNKVVALREAGVTRGYAIPGSVRCNDCHEGSHNRSFVLGWTPLQIKRRPMGEGGVIEPAGADELTQLQRLVDYGVVSRVSSPDDVLPLEKSQGDRVPRNDYELAAQGYMLGNCGHCHNPRGDASIDNPPLSEPLRFFPDRDGGIFQFPLDRVSPRIKRGIRQDISVPYITPSVIDLEGDLNDGTYTPKHFPDHWGTTSTEDYIDAPWRSLIYRNVDTPFTYADDYGLFPHMPMHTPGYDCRALRIIGDWMVSIPARLHFDPTNLGATEATDPTAQLYHEVKPGDDGYDAAVSQAKSRLDLYHRGGKAPTVFPAGGPSFVQHLGYRHSDYCPDTSDIVASEVQGAQLTPVDESALPSLAHDKVKDDGGRLAALAYNTNDGVPDRAHWVVTDITDPPGDWNPRRTDWASVLVDQKLDGVDDRQKTVVGLLQSTTLSSAFRSFALEPVPFGIWEQKSTCNFSSVPKVSSFTGNARPAWMDIRSPRPKPEDPVYMQSPGATVFNEICINCHGPKFDSLGRQAETLMVITGGATRVANLRDGLFGPVMDPGSNRQRVFGPSASSSTTADDWAVRYFAWMGLGGTQRIIPQMILRLVGTAQVLGDDRPNAYDPAAKSANMLAIAQTLCSHTLGRKGSGNVEFDLSTGAISNSGSAGTSLIGGNGDAEHWQRLCSFQNPAPIRVVTTNGWVPLTSGTFYVLVLGTGSWYNPATYPSNALVGDEHGNTAMGVTSANQAPWCVLPPTDSAGQAAADKYVQDARGGKPLPFCPTSWLNDTNKLSETDLDRWTLKGAINAGASVFVYLDQLSHDAVQGKEPQPGYDQCEQLK
jgi:mono/diheme cytochrome c family protein